VAPDDEKPSADVLAPADAPVAVEASAEPANAKPVVPKAEPAVAKAEPAVEAKAEPAVEAKAEPAVEAKTEPAVEARAEPAVAAVAPSAARAVDANTELGVVIELCGRTDVGLVREHNEDSFLVIRLDDSVRDLPVLRKHPLGERGTLLLVCDGMGGAAAGEVASNMAVESIAATMLGNVTPPAPDGVVDDAKAHLARKLRYAAKDANLQIFREARQNLARAGMGTTMTAVLLTREHAIIAQVGDSRAYVWRQGAFTQVTRDQSLVNQLLETGHITPEQAKFFEHSNVILQALGVQEDVEVQLSKVELRRGDRFVVCSDGLVGVVSDEEIGAVLGAVDDPEEAARMLVELANSAGGPDNISVIVARVEGELPEAGVDEVLSYQLWKIEPDPPPPSPSMDENTQPAIAQPAPPPPPVERLRPASELISSAVVVGLVLGSVVTGAAIYKRAVPCRVETKLPGLAVVADGRDSGARTIDGAVELRLRPGRHTLSLRGQGAPDSPLEIDVAAGVVCGLTFAPPPRPTASPAPAAPAVQPVDAGASDASPYPNPPDDAPDPAPEKKR
jgi:protein phosphatase